LEDVSFDFDNADELSFIRYIQRDVLSVRQILCFFSRSAIRHRLRTGRWQRPHRGVILTTTARTLTRTQQHWVAVLAAPGALLGGRSALEVLGLRGFLPRVVDVVLPPGRKFDRPPPWVRTHRTRHLLPEDVLRARQPPCTSIGRAVVDAARWAVSADEARTVIAMAFQQRLVADWEITAVLRRMPTVPRAQLIAQTTTDASGGAHSLPELDFLALSRRAGFPEPKLQAMRRDADGRRRYVDALYEKYGVLVEIDGGQHMDVRQAWADMRRQNALWVTGVRVLRFPGWLVREQPDVVIAHVGAALRAAGWPG
jgi:hypothetical protein